MVCPFRSIWMKYIVLCRVVGVVQGSVWTVLYFTILHCHPRVKISRVVDTHKNKERNSREDVFPTRFMKKERRRKRSIGFTCFRSSIPMAKGVQDPEKDDVIQSDSPLRLPHWTGCALYLLMQAAVWMLTG